MKTQPEEWKPYGLRVSYPRHWNARSWDAYVEAITHHTTAVLAWGLPINKNKNILEVISWVRSGPYGYGQVLADIARWSKADALVLSQQAVREYLDTVMENTEQLGCVLRARHIDHVLAITGV